MEPDLPTPNGSIIPAPASTPESAPAEAQPAPEPSAAVPISETKDEETPAPTSEEDPTKVPMEPEEDPATLIPTPAPVVAVKSGSKLPKLKKQPNSGTGVAIIATVIIVLGIAVLAVFAYFKSQHISI